MKRMSIKEWYESTQQLHRELDRILSKSESSGSRIITIMETYSKLKKLSLLQEDLLMESIKCIEQGLFRAAHVLSWSAFIDFAGEKLGEDGFKKLNSITKLSITSNDELREKKSDSEIIEFLKNVGLIKSNSLKSLKGLLAKRNECAHPSDYKPGLNETLGYVTELLKRIELLQNKKIPP